MGFKINIFTGQPEISEAGGGSGVQVPNYIFSFDSTTSWGSPSGGLYTLVLLQATHLKGVTPLVQVWEKVGSDYQIIAIPIEISSLGDITLQVSQSPDNRFEGRILVSENN